MKIFSTLALAFLSAGFAFSAEDARSLLEASEARHRSATMTYSGELTVVSKDGRERSKAWRSYREGFAGDSKVLVRFTAPPEVKGVGFLSLSRPGKNADQWLYLPAMKRERRISPQDRDASFVGTDFSYEDMEEFDHKKYSVKVTGEETLEGQPCYRIEALSSEKGEKSVYVRRILFLRKDILYLVREDLYREDEDEPAKRLLLGDLTPYGSRWTAKRLTMLDLKKGSRTVVALNEVLFDKEHPKGRFTLQNLTREGGD